MNFKTSFFLLIFLVCAIPSIAQKQNNIWYFGTGAGLTFNGGAPVFLAGGKTNCYEGVATICDNAGNLLFYTDGVSVWDKTHTQMPNGNGLLGDNSSTESAIILQKPGSQNLYYIFTAPVVGIPNPAKPASYSIVDMTLNGGNGDVTSTKNVTILAPATEKLTYVRHANGTDYWIVYHKWNSSDYNVYLLSASGLNLTPVVSTTGIFIANNSTFNDIGYLKSSPCGDHLAMADEGLKTIELLDFNNSTGLVSNGYTLATLTEQFATYGTEFSPGGNFLYCSTNYPGHVYQFNLKAGSLSAIAASKTLVGSSAQKCGAMQTGPDGKIYITQQGGQFLCTINNPDLAGNACNFVDNAVACTGGVFALPNYVAEQFCSAVVNKPRALFGSNDTIICAGNCSSFKNNSLYAISYQWTFSGGNPSSSINSTPTVCYTAPGQYPVQLIATNALGSDTLFMNNYVTVVSPPIAGTITSTLDSICEGTGISSLLTNTGSTGTIQWQSSPDSIAFSDITGATSLTYTTPPTLSQTTYYRVTAHLGTCPAVPSSIIAVHIVPSPVAVFTYSINGQQVTFNSTGTSSDVTTYNWDFGDGSNSSLTNPGHTFATKDTFNVCLTVYNGSNCSYTICQDIIIGIGSGVRDIAQSISIQLYPNPVTDEINLVTEVLTGEYELKIYNVLGQQVVAMPMETIHTPLQIPLDNFTNGTYLLVLSNNTEYYSRRFVRLR